MKKTSRYFKFLKNKYVIIALVVLAVGAFFVFRSGTKAPVLETATATTTNIVEKVGVTGKVAPFQKSELGFEKGGSISSISVAVGDKVEKGRILAALSDEQTHASLLSAQASLRAAEANLADNITDTNLDFTNSQKNALTASRNAYVSVNSAIVNGTDMFFTSATSINPTLSFTPDSYSIQRSVENKRAAVSQALEAWRTDLENLSSPSDASTLLDRAVAHVVVVKDFLAALSTVVNAYVRNNSPSSASTATTYLETINTANTDLNTAIGSLTTAQNNLDTTRPKSVLSLQAKVEQAQADVANLEAQYAKSFVRAPFDGVVTKVDPEIGDVVSGGQQLFAIMGGQSFKVEVNVPEANIAKIALGNKASITLDAYGEDVVFPATVILIDPAETVVEGVPTYKVTLQFDSKDDRIRSGMTANIDIIVGSKENVVGVPFRAVLEKDGKQYVRVVNADGKTFTEVPVTTGIKGSEGLVEIVSGIASGTTIVTFAK